MPEYLLFASAILTIAWPLATPRPYYYRHLLGILKPTARPPDSSSKTIPWQENTHIKGTVQQPRTSFVQMLNFVFIRGVVSFILSQKMNFRWERNVAALGGTKALQRDRKDAHLGARRRCSRIFGDKFRGLGVYRPL